MLNGLDLFSGIGGLAVALAPWVKPVAYCDNDRYAQAVLLSRMAAGDLPIAPIWDDVRNLRGDTLPDIDIICGGFPCQDVSVAGARAGLDGERSGLFFEVVRLTKEIRPALIFLENVAGIRPQVPRIRANFEALGYECRDGFIQAPPLCGFEGIRWFLLAAAEGYLGQERVGVHEVSSWPARPIFGAGQTDVPPAWEASFGETGRDVDELPYRLERLKSMGNAVVPVQARQAFKILSGIGGE